MVKTPMRISQTITSNSEDAMYFDASTLLRHFYLKLQYRIMVWIFPPFSNYFTLLTLPPSADKILDRALFANVSKCF